MFKQLILVFGLVAVGPINALACSKVEVESDRRVQLFEALKDAQNEMEGRLLGDQIWRIWTTAPDPKSQSMLDTSRERIRYGDYETAETVLTKLIDYCPDYAEGWNQRAFARFLRQDYDRALDDIEQVLEREPKHFGALSGRAVTLLQMGRTEVGHTALREALKVNPWLSERHMLPPGEDI